MGFLKSKKNTNEDSLDIPPPPPMDMPGMNSQNMQGDFPPLDEPPMPPLDSPDMAPEPPKFPGPTAPPPRRMPPMPQQAPPMPQQAPPMPQQAPPMPEDEPIDEAPEESFGFDIPEPEHHEEMHEEHPQKSFDELFKPHPTSFTSSGKPIFIEIGKYKGVLKELNNIKKSLKMSDKELQELVTDIQDEENIFINLQGNLADVEKKLLELEESLFAQ